MSDGCGEIKKGEWFFRIRSVLVIFAFRRKTDGCMTCSDMENLVTTDPRTGLCGPEVERMRSLHGANVLPRPKRESPWRLYAEKFKDPVIRVLIVAAAAAFGLGAVEGSFAEPVGIVCAIVLATGIGFYFEYDAARRFDVLNAMGCRCKVRVRRDGVVCEVDRDDVVVGDIVILEAGDEIPADGLLLGCGVEVTVNESALTGEPSAVKCSDAGGEDEVERAAYPRNLLLRGTTVLEGGCEVSVVSVGVGTEIGKVAREATRLTGEQTPLNLQLSRLARVISKVGYTVAAVAFVVFTVRDVVGLSADGWGADEWRGLALGVLNNFMMAVTLVVMAVPEGLPMAVTLSLALNMRRMLRTNNLVRRMHACETMGAVTVICTDKTGTLTENCMRVSEMVAVRGGSEAAVACNCTASWDVSSGCGLGNPTEMALLRWLSESGVDVEGVRGEWRVEDRMSFSSLRKLMATIAYRVGEKGHRMLFVKGAPEVVLGLCGDLSDAERGEWAERLAVWQSRAERTLAVAERVADAKDVSACDAVGKGGLRLLAVCAISDPVRSEVPDAVARCLGAGVDIKIVTGDSTGTAVEIARRIGLWGEGDRIEKNCIGGAEWETLDEEEALRRVSEIKVMSRARPMDKLRLVRLLKERGHVVAVTGDGTNDAPALHNAHVGLAMGSGTSVAKEAGDMTLLDDSFGSVVAAVKWGRSLYRNIQRFAMFQLTINATALAVVLLGSFLGTALPLTVTQMLWVNIIMDSFAALALSSLPPEESVMADRPRERDAFIITRGMWTNIVCFGTVFTVVLLGMLKHGGRDDVHWLTVFFTFFVMLQFWNLLNAKCFGTTDSAFRGLGKDRVVLCVLGMIFVGQWLIVEYGGSVFRTVALDWREWLAVVASSSCVLWVGEIVRFVGRLGRRRV